MRLFRLSGEPYSTVIEYALVAAGVGLLLLGTFAPAARPLAFVFAAWLGLNVCVFVWLFWRVAGTN